MTLPGPQQLGRGVVVAGDAPAPAPWADAPQVALTPEILGDVERVAALTDRLHRAWVGRTPVVVRWGVPGDAFDAAEADDAPPWQLEPGFLFPHERLRFLCFSNNYDARNGEPRWWWSVKAHRIGLVPGGPADGNLPSGEAVWIDGGPRSPLPAMDYPVIHGESVDLGLAELVIEPAVGDVEGLAHDQAEAVGHVAGPARIIAPAGSGKTRTLTARVRHMLDVHGIDRRQLVAVAYNDRAAAELRERLDVDRSMARTIHSLGWEILRQARPGLDLLDERGVREQLERLIAVPRRANADPYGPYLEALSAVRSRLRDPEEVEASRDDVAGFADAFEMLRSRMYAMGRVDHGEQIYGAIEVLLSDPDLRASWQRRCRHLLVDEFQDLTPAFVLLLRLLASPQLDVFGVGDDDQVIYGYDGADPGFLIDFDRYFPGAGVHALEVNYRCPPAIVEAATHLLSYNRRRIDKTIRAARGESDGETLVVETVPSDTLATAAADRITGWIEAGVRPTEIAVLTRVNASLIPIKAALVGAGVLTNDLVSAASLDRTVVRALFAWMRMGMKPERITRRDALTAVQRPSRGLNRLAREILPSRPAPLEELYAVGTRLDGKQAGRWEQFCDDITAVAGAAAQGDTARLIAEIVDRVGLGSSARTLDSGRGNASRSGHHDDLVAVRRATPLHPEADGFQPWLRDTLDTPRSAEGVTLSSVHRVKGMEWSRVVVFGVDRGAMPHDLSDDQEEERRVFHVALTRAVDEAVVLADERRPSPFLAELDGSAPRQEAVETKALGRPSRRRAAASAGDKVRLWGGAEGVVTGVKGDVLEVRLATGAETEAAPGDVVEVISAPPPPLGEVDAALVDSLKEWRRETSRRLSVPAYVVVHDRAIEEIARRKPSSESQLLTVTGIGPAKLETFGDDILALVAAASGD